jgi:hypothetical protein
MTKEKLKQVILESVNGSTGVRGVELALTVLNKTMPHYFEPPLYQEALEELVNEGEILELEYTLPEMDYRIKSIFFPKGTQIKAA